MTNEEIKIELTEEIEKIIEKNLENKSEKIIKKIDCCKNCRFYDKPWIWGRTLHCCSYDSDNPTTSRDINKLYNSCPINHEIEVTKNYIKKYGIIHHKPKQNSWSSYKGSISVVDFSGTTFEWDGYNPNVDWESVVTFYYNDQKEADIMMKLAVEYYHQFNLDAEYVPKYCYG